MNAEIEVDAVHRRQHLVAVQRPGAGRRCGRCRDRAPAAPIQPRTRPQRVRHGRVAGDAVVEAGRRAALDEDGGAFELPAAVLLDQAAGVVSGRIEPGPEDRGDGHRRDRGVRRGRPYLIAIFPPRRCREPAVGSDYPMKARRSGGGIIAPCHRPHEGRPCCPSRRFSGSTPRPKRPCSSTRRSSRARRSIAVHRAGDAVMSVDLRAGGPAVHGPERRPALTVHRGGLVLRLLRHAAGGRRAVGQAAGRRRQADPVRLAEGPVRAVVADHPERAAAAARRSRSARRPAGRCRR